MEEGEVAIRGRSRCKGGEVGGGSAADKVKCFLR